MQIQPDLIQWAIPIVVGILTFLGGRLFEQRRLAQQNRLKLLEPIEEWVEEASRLKGIVGDDLTSLGEGLPIPPIYEHEDRKQTAKKLYERRQKVLGILESKALQTFGTRGQSRKLTSLLQQLYVLIESRYIPAYNFFSEALEKRHNLKPYMMELFSITTVANSIIQDIHGCLALLKTRYT